VKLTKDGRLILAGIAYRDRKGEVWERDGKRCVRCLRSVELDESEMHHRERRGMGGATRTDVMENLETLCPRCHRGTHDEERRLHFGEHAGTTDRG
jgi:5-methylcytosine-specific restriction endonuclease McrA